MKKVNSVTTYQLSLDDLKEALTLYMKQVHNTEVNIKSLEEIIKTKDVGFGYDYNTYLDGIKIHAE